MEKLPWLVSISNFIQRIIYKSTGKEREREYLYIGRSSTNLFIVDFFILLPQYILI